MSRWDALKPKKDDLRSDRWSRKAARSLPNPLGSRRKRREDDPSSTVLQHARYSSLVAQCRTHPDDTGSLVSLARLVEASHSVVPAETNANNVVYELFLPYLSRSSSGTDSAAIGAILFSLKVLCQDSKHGSAIFASLVDNVVVDTGTEQLVANPVRLRLFRVLQERLLLRPAPSAEVTESVCQCLTEALGMAKKVDGTRHHAALPELDVNVQNVQQFLGHVLAQGGDDDERMTCPALELLRALLRRHPESAASLAGFLLFRDISFRPTTTGQHETCETCGFDRTRTTLFLKLLHAQRPSKNCVRAADLAMDCAAEMLNSLPLQLWLRKEKSAPNSSFAFRNRVSEALGDIVRSARCRETTKVKFHPKHYCPLVKSILIEIPGDHDATLQSASELVGLIAGTLTDSTTETKVRDAVRDVLMECVGGKVTPQGQLTKMSVPVRIWLHSCNGRVFVETALSHIPTESENVPKKEWTSLLRAMLRTCPDIVLQNEKLWLLFLSTVEKLVHSEDGCRRLVGAQLMEGLLRGRKDFGATETVVTSSVLLSFVMPNLKRLILEGEADSKGISCAANGCLLASDWKMLSSEGTESPCGIISPILSFCTNDAMNAKTRREACKATGEICSQYFTPECFPPKVRVNLDVVGNLCNDIIRSMNDASSDPLPSVISMALFAVGNLAQALQNLSPLRSRIDPDVLSTAAFGCYNLMRHQDEKVVGNAIRSTGHLACLYLCEDVRSILRDAGVNVTAFLQQVTESLASFVRTAISVALGDTAQRSWKQRLAARKHGWGACNSLALLFKQGIAQNADGTVLLEKPVARLLECIEHLSALNEKVVLSASFALCCLDVAALSSLAGHYGSIGTAIVACFEYLFDGGPSTSQKLRMRQKVEGLLLHLVRSANSADAGVVIQSKRLSQQHLSQLYQWMVEKDCSSDAFSRFALAMQMPGANVEVQIEQQFSSRAVTLATTQQEEGEWQDEL